MEKCVFVTISLLSMLMSTASTSSRDSDHDGLSDFQEIHKYQTDPKKKDTDGDDIPDGDWHERREYTYTIRTVVKVMRPCNMGVVNDDYQDAKVLSETKDYVELEVIHYPFNTNANTIDGNRDWKKHSSIMNPYLQPGITTNWDAKMRQDLLAGLKAAGIDIDTLTDRQVVEKVSPWAMRRSRSLDKVFTTYYIHYPDGQPSVYPGLEDAFKREFERDCVNYDWKVDHHYDHELLGRGMYYNKTYGSCTSFAVYLTTVLRAIGIPTRMALAIPIVDPSDPKQIQLVENHIAHHKVRQTLLAALQELKGFTAHTFNEVYVDGRWARLNYSTLGQNTYGKGAMGALTHVHTFRDLTEANLAATWGLRYGKGLRDSVFKYNNPYRTTEISDRFGIHCRMENPRVKEKKIVVITKAYWFFSEDRPKSISDKLVRQDNHGHVLFHVDASFNELRAIYPKLGKTFVLSTEGRPDVIGSAERGYWNSECYIRIPREELVKMVPGVPYKIRPTDQKSDYRWEVKDNVRITKRYSGPGQAVPLSSTVE